MALTGGRSATEGRHDYPTGPAVPSNVIGKAEEILTVIPRRLFRLATLHVPKRNFFGNLRRSAISGNLTTSQIMLSLDM
jgi:hypothetical protein